MFNARGADHDVGYSWKQFAARLKIRISKLSDIYQSRARYNTLYGNVLQVRVLKGKVITVLLGGDFITE